MKGGSKGAGRASGVGSGGSTNLRGSPAVVIPLGNGDVVGQGSGIGPTVYPGGAGGITSGGGGGESSGMSAWPSLVPDYSSSGSGGVTSETRQVDELGIATRLAEYSRDARWEAAGLVMYRCMDAIRYVALTLSPPWDLLEGR